MRTTVFLSWTVRQPCFLSMMDMEVTFADHIGDILEHQFQTFGGKNRFSVVLFPSKVLVLRYHFLPSAVFLYSAILFS